MNYFRNNLAYLRKKNGYSLDTFADMVDKDIRWIEHCERNLIEPDLESLVLLSSIFKVSLDDFLKTDIEKKEQTAKKKK
jgi:transcriptional regulator with XRE-family HTH domain